MPQILFTLKVGSNNDEQRFLLAAANDEVAQVTENMRGFAKDAAVQILENLGESDKTMMVILWNDGPMSDPFQNHEDAISSLGMDGDIWQDYRFII